MSILSKILGFFGAGFELKVPGPDGQEKAYTFKQASPLLRDRLEKDYYTHRLGLLREIKDDLGEEAYLARLDKLSRDYDEGAFAWPAPDLVKHYLVRRLPHFLALYLGVDEAEAAHLAERHGTEAAHLVTRTMLDANDLKKKIDRAPPGKLAEVEAQLAKHPQVQDLLALLTS